MASVKVLPTYSLGISREVHTKLARRTNRLCSEYEFILSLLQKHIWSDFYAFCKGIEVNAQNIYDDIPVGFAYLSPKLLYFD